MTRVVKLKTGNRMEEIGHYSRIVAVDNWIEVSNTAGRNPQTKEIPEDVTEQARQVFANIEGALQAVGAGLADVIRARVYIQNPADIPKAMDVFSEKFKGIDPALTMTCPPLGSSVYKVEIEVTAYRGAGVAETERLNITL